MLVLTRQVQESIQIGENVRVTVTKITGNRVRLGIEAPASMAIRRSEIAELVESPDPAAEKDDGAGDRGGELDRQPPNQASPDPAAESSGRA